MREIFPVAPAFLASLIAFMAFLNYGVTWSILRHQEAQTYVTFEPPGGTVPPRARSRRARLTLPFVTAAMAIVFTVFPDPAPRAILAGGYLIVQLFGIAFSIGNLLAYGALGMAGAAEGQIRYSAFYQYKHQSAYLAGFALLALTLAALASSFEFFGAFIWLGATSLGYSRRAGQAARVNR
jgi:hypothetical protein